MKEKFKKYCDRQIKHALIFTGVSFIFFYIFLNFIVPILPKYLLTLFDVLVIFVCAFIIIVFGILTWLCTEQLKEIREARRSEREWSLKEIKLGGNIRRGMTTYPAEYYSTCPSEYYLKKNKEVR